MITKESRNSSFFHFTDRTHLLGPRPKGANGALLVDVLHVTDGSLLRIGSKDANNALLVYISHGQVGPDSIAAD